MSTRIRRSRGVGATEGDRSASVGLVRSRFGPMAAGIEMLRDPLHRASLALNLSTAITSLLGFVFWLLAARLFSPADVGTGAALTSTMVYLASVSTFGLGNSLVRFLPEAGSSARRLVATAYAVTAGTAMLAGAIFVLGQPWWADRLTILKQSLVTEIGFVLAVGVWGIFVLQDQVLVGLHRAEWVPVANGSHSVAKLVFLVVPLLGAGWAIFGASVIPGAAVILVFSVLVFTRFGKTFGRGAPAHQLQVGSLIRFALSDHVSALLWLATCDLLVLAVLHKAGAEASAYYFMSFTIAYSLYMVTENMSSALVAQAAKHPDQAAALTRRALVSTASLVGFGAVVGFAIAPVLLGVLGPSYAAEGTTLLRLLIVSALPQVVIGLALARARIRRDNRFILIIYTILTVGIFGGSVVLIDVWGLSGVGIAWLGTQVVVALVLAFDRRTGVRRLQEKPVAATA